MRDTREPFVPKPSEWPTATFVKGAPTSCVAHCKKNKSLFEICETLGRKTQRESIGQDKAPQRHERHETCQTDR